MKKDGNSNNNTDKSLFLKLKQKDREAFIEAYDKYVDDIYRFIFFKVNQKQEAEDITSQVFLKSWNHIQTNSIKDYKTLKAFFYKVARNLIIDHYRKNSHKQDIEIDRGEFKIDLPDERQDAHKNLEIKSDFDRLSQSLLQLKDEYREIVTLRYVNELSFSEIAKIMDKSKGNIRVMLYRAMKALREISGGN